MAKTAQPTIYDVAQKAGVSIATVSRVLNGFQQVSADTRRKVLSAVDELGFVPKADAVARARAAVGQIGIVSPFFTIPSFGQRMRGVAQVLANSPYELVIYTVDSLHRYESLLAQLSLNQQLDGLIINALPLPDEAIQGLQASPFETVLMECSHPGFCSIQIDNELGGRLAAQHLLARGYRHFAYLDYAIDVDHAIHPGYGRLRGYQQVLAQSGITLLEHNIVAVPLDEVENTRQQIRALLEKPDAPTAIFVAVDYLALFVAHIAQERGIKIPKDLGIVGFDDIELAAVIGLTTISQSLDETGQLAARLLLNRLSNPNEPMQHITIQLKLVKREST